MEESLTLFTQLSGNRMGNVLMLPETMETETLEYTIARMLMTRNSCSTTEVESLLQEIWLIK